MKILKLLELPTEDDFTIAAHEGVEKFQKQRFTWWIENQAPDTQRIAKQFPPTKVYRLREDKRTVAIAGYKNGKIMAVIWGGSGIDLLNGPEIETWKPLLEQDLKS